MAEQLQQRVLELERQLASVTHERELLQADVENLCLQTGKASQWSNSTVLSDRVKAAETEVARLRHQLTHMTLERDSAQDDLVQVRACTRTLYA